MKWNWDPRTWKTSPKVLLGLITIWPIIYIALVMPVYSYSYVWRKPPSALQPPAPAATAL